MFKFLVKIDEREKTLTYDSHSFQRGFQYLTANHGQSHAFNFELKVGWKFRTNGHVYEILQKIEK